MMDLKLPDFDEMLDMASDIGGLARDMGIVKSQLNSELAAITRIVMQDEQYWVGVEGKKKPPAMNYIQTTYHVEGYSKESKRRIDEFVNNIAGMEGELEYLKKKFQIYSYMIDVWKADQYNKNQAQY